MTLAKPEEESELVAALARAYAHSPFWRHRLQAIGVGEHDFKLGFPFAELPLLTKPELLEDQAAHPPFGRLRSVELDQVRRVHRTSGTMGVPLFIALTERDIRDTYVASCRAFKLAGIGPGDRIVHCLNFNMWSGGLTDYLPLEELGATGVPFGVGNTSMLLRTIRALGINAISCTPSYMLVLGDRCREELQIAPTELGLRRGYFGGEGLLQVPGVREEIESTFGLTAIDANYGMSEVLSIIAGEGPDRDGLVYHGYGIVYAELIDPDGRPVGIEAGAEGELVFSSLRREAQPLFRYRTNDLVRVMWADVGEDGLLRMKFQVKGRTDEMLVIKGVNFFPQALLSIFPEYEREVGRGFRVMRPQSGEPESLRIVLETHLGAGPLRDALALKIQARIASTFQVKTAVMWVPIGRIRDEGNKSRFLVDRFEDI